MAIHKLVTSVLSQDMIDWVKETAGEAGIGGGAVLRELISQEMRNKNSQFRRELAQAKDKLLLQKYNDQELELAQKKEEILKRLKGQRVAVPA